MDVQEVLEEVDVLTDRIDFLECLNEEPLHKPDLEERLGHSRSTVDRAIGALEEAGLVERVTRGWVATPVGIAAADRYRAYLEDQRALLEAKDTLNALPYDTEIPSSVLTNATIESVDRRYPLLESIASELETADRYRLVLPSRIDSRHLRIWASQALRGDLSVTLAVRETTLSQYRTDFPNLTTDLAESGSVTAVRGETPPFGVLLPSTLGSREAKSSVTTFSGDSSRSVGECPDGPIDGHMAGETLPSEQFSRVILILFDDDDTINGYLTTRDENAIAWAYDRFKTTVRNGEYATDDLRKDGTLTDLTVLTSEELPMTLRREGFFRIDEAYLDKREPMKPETGLRAGFGVAEVAAGYAIDRFVERAEVRIGETAGLPDLDEDSKKTPLSTVILERLDAVGNVAVIGPPGSGKSTTCKQVAYRFHEDRNGTVVYREGATGDAFESPAVLQRYLEASSGPCLVVVEDVLRPEAVDVFRTIEGFSGDPDVNFLLDARSNEWFEPMNSLLEPRLDAFRHEEIDTISIPGIDHQDCRQLIDRIETLTERRIAASPEDLLVDIEPSADGAGTMLFVSHRLSTYVDPLSGFDDHGVSAFDSDVDAIRTALESIGERALDVGVLVSLLNVAGLGVYPGYVHSLSLRDETPEIDRNAFEEVRAALARLDGHVLFETGDRARYETVHETWSTRFLERFLEATSELEGRRRFGRCITGLLRLADDSKRRESIVDLLGNSPAIEEILSDPRAWADDATANVFGVGRTYASLAPLYGTSTNSRIELPETCSVETALQCLVWRGELRVQIGDLDNGEREFELLEDRLTSGSVNESSVDEVTERFRIESAIGRARVEKRRGKLESAAEYATDALERSRRSNRTRQVARSHYTLGTIAQAAGDLERAEVHFTECLERSRATESTGLEADATIELVTIARRMGRYERAEELLDSGDSMYRSIGDRRGMARVERQRGAIRSERGETEFAHDHYLGALEFAEEVRDRKIQATVLNDLGQLEATKGDLDEARRYYERGIERTRTIEETPQEQTLLLNRGGIAMALGNLERAERFFERGYETARELGDRIREARALDGLSHVAYESSSFDEAREIGREAQDVANDLHDQRLQVRTALSLGRALLAVGDLDSAESTLTDAVEKVRGISHPMLEANVLDSLAMVRVLRGDLNRAKAHGNRLLDLGEDYPVAAGQGAKVLGHIALQRKDFDEAATRFSAAVDGYRDGGSPENAAMMAVFRARSDRLVGRYERAAVGVEEALDGACAHGSTRVEAVAWCERGALTRDRGALDDAVSAFERGIDDIKNDGTRIEVVRGLYEYGTLEWARGNHRGARESIEESATLALEMGPTVLSQRIVDTLGDLCHEQDDRGAAREWRNVATNLSNDLDSRARGLGSK